MTKWAGRLALAAGVMLLSFPAGGCKNSTIPAQWTSTAITVDGQSSDWSELRTTYFEDEQVVLGIANDSSRLYILFRFKELQWARAIRMSGLTFWFDPKGGKDKKIMLSYNGGPALDELRNREPSDHERLARNMPPEFTERGDQMMREREPQLQIMIEDRIAKMPIAADGSLGPQVAFAMDHGMFCYEFSIPLQESEVRLYGLGAAPGSAVGIGAEWGGMPSDRPKLGMGGPMTVGGPPGGGTFDGGGPPGGPGSMGGTRGERMNAPEKQDVRLKTRLASGPAD